MVSFRQMLLQNDATIFGIILVIAILGWYIWPPLAAAWIILWVLLVAVCFSWSVEYHRQSYVGLQLDFVDPENIALAKPAPSIAQDATLDLSVVVPAFNEEARIKAMLDEAVEWLTQQQLTWEIIVVDDCSKDETSAVVLQYSKLYQGQINLVKLKVNRGKGFAVKQGFYCSRGAQILMADADGATKFADLAALQRLFGNVQNHGEAVICGSRKHLVGSEAVAKRTPLRNFLMHLFHFCVSFTFWAANGSRGLDDTQCGFKLLSRGAAREIFKHMHVERWCFDVELLLIARQLAYPVVEFPVNWHEIPGSKLRVSGMAVMGLELVLLCVMYRFRLWRFSDC